jgi:hypothetical protein
MPREYIIPVRMPALILFLSKPFLVKSKIKIGTSTVELNNALKPV